MNHFNRWIHWSPTRAFFSKPVTSSRNKREGWYCQKLIGRHRRTRNPIFRCGPCPF